jgi:hypothetical protein
MKYTYLLLACLGSLLVIILWAAIGPQVQYASGYPHPDIAGMYISKATIDDLPLTRWLGYFFGVGIIFLFAMLIYIGNLKAGKTTGIARFIIIGMIAYWLVYTGMVLAHWQYDKGLNDFFFWLPKPTAWMFIGLWFVPLIITCAYYFRFEKYVISKEEETAYKAELANYYREND